MNTKGTNDNEISESLRKFLKFAGADMERSSRDYEDEFVFKLQKSVEKVRNSREFGAVYMKLEELMNEKFKEGKKIGLEEGRKQQLIKTIVVFLSDSAPVSDSLNKRISSIEDMEILSKLCKLSAGVSSHKEFEENLDKMNL